MLWLALLLLSMPPLARAHERRQAEPSDAEAPVVAETSFDDVSSETVTGSATITVLTSVDDEPSAVVIETTATETQASDTDEGTTSTPRSLLSSTTTRDLLTTYRP